MTRPEYDPAKDGNRFAWILAQAKAIRSAGGFDLGEAQRVRAEREAKRAIERALLSSR